MNQHRITEVPVDGGSGPISDAGGSDETTLDVEQSGGVALGAKILVYEAPNTSQGFVDAFAAATDSNRADTVSTSWGEWEAFDGSDPVLTNGTVTDPTNGQQTTIIAAYDDLLAQAALQGQSFIRRLRRVRFEQLPADRTVQRAARKLQSGAVGR